jgi:hypothetical protein
MRVRKENPPSVVRPWWVGFALWGLPNRGSAVACLAMLLWVAGLAVFLGFYDVRQSLGVLAAYLTVTELRAILWCLGVLSSLFALWYLRAIVWVDRNGGWAGKRAGPASGGTSGDPVEPPPNEPPREDAS